MRRSRRWVFLTAALATWAAAAVPAAASGGQQPRPRTERVSVAADGTQADVASHTPAITADGRHVAFLTRASVFVPGTPRGRHLYLKDLRTGAVERANVSEDDNPDLRWVYEYSLSATGRYVVFASAAEEMGPGHVVDKHLYVRDRATGRTEPLLDDGRPGGAGNPVISADGRYVAFDSPRTDLVPGGGKREYQVYVHDRVRHTTRRVSVASDGAAADGFSHLPVISADGSEVGFLSVADNLGTAGGPRPAPRDTSFYVHDMRTGRTRPAAQRQDGTPAAVVTERSLTPDGRYALFCSSTPGIVTGYTGTVQQCYAKDLRAGVTRMVSLAPDGAPADGHTSAVVMGADHRRVFFTSWAHNLLPGGAGEFSAVYARDLRTGAVERIDVAADGTGADGLAGGTSVDRSGRVVAFESWAGNLVTGDTNDTGDVFVRRLT
ncbi:hypothetical protein [Streptomyces sp. NPDC049585]|uniref:TolB family protein n=1 Tax=Streptomyces sp. NPDC049585 TaxID=3155154 RepID=UPI003440C30F